MNSRPTVFYFREHACFPEFGDEGVRASFLSVCTQLELPPTPDPNRLLGFTRTDGGFSAHYFIGTAWLGHNRQHAVCVLPKLEDLDFCQMFMDAFSSEIPEKQNAFCEIFKVRFNEECIPINNSFSQIKPFVVIYFSSLIRHLVRRGLMGRFRLEERNLQGRLKGKLLATSHLKQNVLKGNLLSFTCRYQLFDINCLENRLLKKALIWCRRFVAENKHFFGAYNAKIANNLNYALGAFSGVSDKISYRESEVVRPNPVFREYAQAIKLAKVLLNDFLPYGFNEGKETDEEFSFPPFFINMPLLFEYYVYAKLFARYGNRIEYHLSSRGNETDFVKRDERLIIDAKYKIGWDSRSIRHLDVRQICGYARNLKIRERLNAGENEVLPGLFVYPGEGSGCSLSCGELPDRLCDFPPLEGYLKIHKLAVCLPKTKKD